MSAEISAKRVFLSHSHADNDFSRRLVQSLAEAGLSVWYDEQNLGAGHLAEIIERELSQADTYIIVLSPSALASQWVQDERQAAWDLRREGKLSFFVPVVLEACEIPLLLRGMHRVEFFKDPYDVALAHLLKLLGIAPVPQTAPARSIPTLWEEEAVISAHARGCYCLDGSPHGNFLATGSYDKTVTLWDAHSHQKPGILVGHTQGVDAVAWSPDGTQLASASLGQGIRIWNPSNGEQVTLLEGHSGAVTGIGWSPNGRYLASASADETVRVWSVPRSACKLVIRGHTAPLTSVTWSPDGQWIGSTARDATVRIWNAATGSPLYNLTGHNGVAYCVRWSPDSSMLASSGNTTVRLWSFASGEPLATLTGHTGYVLRLTWQPDGSGLASSSADKLTGRMVSTGSQMDNTWPRAGAHRMVPYDSGEQ
jgi:WD40 repeat protein